MSEATTQSLSGSETIELLFPLETGISKLTMRRPKVRDIRAASQVGGGDVEVEIAMFANLCEVAPEDINNMDMADYGAIQKVYKSFLSGRKKTSESPASS